MLTPAKAFRESIQRGSTPADEPIRGWAVSMIDSKSRLSGADKADEFIERSSRSEDSASFDDGQAGLFWRVTSGSLLIAAWVCPTKAEFQPRTLRSRRA
jgi:hypothetical protein